MDSPQKLAFVIQSNRLQGLIWQALLKSQKMAIILEPSRNDLAECISQIAAAGLTLPDLIILDAELGELNPYDFCRGCRDTFPQIKVFLTRFRRGLVTDTEKRWARQQGAAGFLDGFYRDTLITTAAKNIRAILQGLEHPFLDEQALLSVLLAIRRQLGTTQLAPASSPLSTSINNNQIVSGKPLPLPVLPSAAQKPAAPDILNDVNWVSSGLRALNRARGSEQRLSGDLFSSAPTAPPAVKPSEIPNPSEPEPESKPAAIRRYRGVVY